MDIALYIAEILEDHDEVTIPGFGTIYKKKVAASFDENTQSFLPPGETFAFTQRENADALLSRHISKTKHISEASADFFAAKFGDDLNRQLNGNGEAGLLPVGTLRKKDGGIYLDLSEENQLMSSFGLVPVTEPGKSEEIPPALPTAPLPPAEKSTEPPTPENISEAPETETANDPEPEIAGTSYRDNDAGEPVQPAAEIKHPEPEIAAVSAGGDDSVLFDKIVLRDSSRGGGFISQLTKPTGDADDEDSPSDRWIWIAAAAVIAIGILSAILYLMVPKAEEEPKDNSKTIASIKTTPSPILPDSLTQADSLRNDSVFRANQAAAAADTAAAADSASFQIILASFHTEKKVQEYISLKRNSNIKLFMITSPKWLFVSAGSYKTLGDALKNLAKVKAGVDTAARVMLIKTPIK
ncbi:hypothetical protein [Hufsiella ginkgonis]|uniref:CCDC81-like prokaryotic HU domain-containing protein n=1 Tax=Hufsiella ginkgonis TaxID=2695274 RepID=A0A7K1XZX0_9SPHI|nr:hypothetical protein [Hufsiella ginkgonis]MXV16289.1 hypothetical protein [Hufsiella ginkgonis]